MPDETRDAGAVEEEMAQVVYAAMQSVSREGQSYPWVEGGNALSQGTARRAARDIIAAVRAESAARQEEK